MRKTNLGVALACTGLLTGLALPAAAESATTYHGSWTSVNDCAGTGDIAGGNWNVTIGKEDKASVSITVFYEQGSLHAAWGGNFFSTKFTQNDPGENTFDVETQNLRSQNLRFVLDDQGHLTYSITGVDCGTSTMTAYLYGELDH